MTNGHEKRQGPITANQLKEVRRDCLKVIPRWYINKSTINHHKETRRSRETRILPGHSGYWLQKHLVCFRGRRSFCHGDINIDSLYL